MKPGGERALTAKAGQALPCPHEDVLGQFLGPLGIAGKPEAQGEDPSHMGVIELPEGIGVTRLGGQQAGVSVHP